jgi:hypothetical protein
VRDPDPDVLVFDHANDSLRREIHATVQMHQLSHRILTFEETLHERAIDDQHWRRTGIIGCVEPPAG